MATPYYLVTAPSDKLEKIADLARRQTDKRRGDPIIAVGSLRIVLLPEAVNGLLDSDPDKSLEEILQPMGAEGVLPINQSRLGELLAAREPSELGVTRATVGGGDTMIDGYDWHVKQTHLVEAWEKLGGPTKINWGNIRVGQIDTGFRAIPCLGFDDSGKSAWVLTDFDRNLFPGDFESGFGISTGNLYSALDPLAGGSSDGHGTRTGSVLSGFDDSASGKGANNQFHGFFGAAPSVPYIPIRISNSIIINDVQDSLAEAIDHLVKHGCQVITLSMGIALAVITDKLKSAINYAYEQGVIFVNAAGNTWDPVVAPARLNRTIAVGGCTPARTPWLGSSFGPEVDICAPAWPIRRATVDRKGNPSYGYGDGTSFATPQVAGTAALWLLHKGDAIAGAYPQKWQRVEAFRRILALTAQQEAGWNHDLYGAGILNAEAVLAAALPDANSLNMDNLA